ncbi:hypothetical protein MHU86_11685 [Fragilaria crotonensis]|nr:hypothetical protein MHU86_11685 [Fragilaria crotonensis]
MDGVNPPRVPEAGDVPEFQAADVGDADIEAANGGDADPHAAVPVVAYLEAPDLGDDDIEAPDFGDDDPQAAEGGDADIEAADGGDADPQTVGRGEAEPQAAADQEDDFLRLLGTVKGAVLECFKGDAEALEGVDFDSYLRSLSASLLKDDYIFVFEIAIKARKLADIAAVNASAAYELADRAEAYLADVTAEAYDNFYNPANTDAVADAKAAVENANQKLEDCDRKAAILARAAARLDRMADTKAKNLVFFFAFSGKNNTIFDSRLEWFAAKTAARTALSVKWQEFMKSRSDIGILTIMSMHEESYPWRKRWTQFLLILVIAVQVALPALLLVYSVQTYTLPNGCPMSANPIQKSVAGAIGCIYLVRIVSKMGSKAKEKLIGIRVVFRDERWLLGALFLDGIMDTWYELVVYGINFYVIFVTPDPLDMVLNSLAFEFIVQLDDVVKETYILKHSKKDDSFFKDSKKYDSIPEVYDMTFEFDREASTKTHQTIYLLNYVVPVYVVTIILPPLALIFLPLCKPDNTAQS